MTGASMKEEAMNLSSADNYHWAMQIGISNQI
jgi:hypothetical protein